MQYRIDGPVLLMGWLISGRVALRYLQRLLHCSTGVFTREYLLIPWEDEYKWRWSFKYLSVHHTLEQDFQSSTVLTQHHAGGYSDASLHSSLQTTWLPTSTE